jgi:predicted PurR-regulated permease PerM
VEDHGTMGTIWAALGMTAYYMALLWINILLGLFLSPLFSIPITWIQDRMRRRRAPNRVASSSPGRV